MPVWLTDVAFGAAIMGCAVEFAILISKATNRQVSLDGGRTWHRSEKKAHQALPLEPGLAQVLAVNLARQQVHAGHVGSPRVVRDVEIVREGGQEHIWARETVYG